MGRRPSRSKVNPHKIHVFTEGESEKIYLEYLRKYIGIKNNSRLVVDAKKKQGLGLLNQVIKEYEKYDFAVSPTTVVLMVDKDDTPKSDLVELEQKCSKRGYQLIFSNVCFELWILLHYEKVTSYRNRGQLKQRITQLAGTKYSKTDKRFFEKTVRMYQRALLNSQMFVTTKIDFDKNPYTNVNQLLEKYFKV